MNKDVSELEIKYKQINDKLTGKYDDELEQLRAELEKERTDKETWRETVNE